jgi:pimeloyl-ACP methyl ester carboxylesterase
MAFSAPNQSTSLPAPAPERMVRANGVDLCVQTFGDPADPAILLIPGAATSMLGWADEFCGRLAAEARFVIRYDQRDTGRSVSYPPGQPGYTGRDLADDAIGLLDALGIECAGLVGMSMGGGVAMVAALDRPERVASLTLIATSAGGPDLPPPSDRFFADLACIDPPDWTDRDAAIDYLVEMYRVYSGRRADFDAAAMRAVLARDLARTANVEASQTNHSAMGGDVPIREGLEEIRVPTLVVHGGEDPAFPVAHAFALARAIPGARLLILPDAGHELPPADWAVVIPAILRLTAGSPSGATTSKK